LMEKKKCIISQFTVIFAVSPPRLKRFSSTLSKIISVQKNGSEKVKIETVRTLHSLPVRLALTRSEKKGRLKGDNNS